MKTFSPLLAALALAALLPSAPNASAEEVYLLRGGFEVFSTGMNQMAKELRDRGVRASAHSVLEWKRIADDIIARNETRSVSHPIIFMGHSLAAGRANDFANYLGEHGIGVTLVIGFDPSGRHEFRQGAGTVVNFRTQGGGRYVAGEGFRGRIREEEVSSLGANHFNLEKHPKIQEKAIAEVMRVIPRRRGRR